MDVNLINSINNLAENVNHLDTSIQLIAAHNEWWNTQWFSALIGAAAGLIGTAVYSTIKDRNQSLFDSYQWFLKQGSFSSPDGLLLSAIITSYGEKDKPLGEKMVIELRPHTKYWYEPYGMFRILIRRYEYSILKIKNGTKEEVKKQKEYAEAQKRFQKVMDFVYKKTGENEWTT